MSADWNEVIWIDDWLPDDSLVGSSVYPEGTREKAAYFSPDDVGDIPLRPNWRYLFKESVPRAPWQFWMEIMAYRIGQVMEVPVPPAYVGLSNRERADQATYGALIEWFYSQKQGYIKGADLLRPLIPDYDDETGWQQNLQTILNVPLFKNVPDLLLKHWAMILAFDTVIGNTDRHPENWGVVITTQPEGKRAFISLSPAFDNGTALSYEHPEEHFARFEDSNQVMRYLKKARRAKHHMRWSLDDHDNMNFFDFMRRFVREYPETRETIACRLEFTEADLRARLEPLTEIPVGEGRSLTPRRLDFTLKMIMRRVSLLRIALENV
jgi:hypothetical protein